MVSAVDSVFRLGALTKWDSQNWHSLRPGSAWGKGGQAVRPRCGTTIRRLTPNWGGALSRWGGIDIRLFFQLVAYRHIFTRSILRIAKVDNTQKIIYKKGRLRLHMITQIRGELRRTRTGGIAAFRPPAVRRTGNLWIWLIQPLRYRDRQLVGCVVRLQFDWRVCDTHWNAPTRAPRVPAKGMKRLRIALVFTAFPHASSRLRNGGSIAVFGHIYQRYGTRRTGIRSKRVSYPDVEAPFRSPQAY